MDSSGGVYLLIGHMDRLFRTLGGYDPLPMGHCRMTRLDWTCDPAEVIAAWPADRPLMVVHSGRGHPRWGRWTIIASPRTMLRVGDDILGDLGRLQAPVPEACPDRSLPFPGGWIGYLGYDLGRRFEPAAASDRHGRVGRVDDRAWPLGEFGWCPDALLLDNRTHTWHAAGELPRTRPGTLGSFSVGALVSSVTPDAYMSSIGRTIEYIAAGDIFQANLTHRLTAPFEGSTRRLCVEAMALSGAWYGAYLELPDGRALLSLSPELFLDVDAVSRRVVTRPIKGTRPSSAPAAELLASAKDAAELNMIIDLVRSDLGRVCEFGSVRVSRARTIETHPTVHHGVAEIAGRLRPETTLPDLLRATFPGGSVTGAPKIRAMQIIDELEPVSRGPYCGAIGFVGAGGRTVLNMAIRTIVLTGERPEGSWDSLKGTLDYGVGGGIVADSDPVAEYRETMDKAEILRRVLGPDHSRTSAAKPFEPPWTASMQRFDSSTA